MEQKRNNRVMAQRVEEGLFVQRSDSTRKAAVYLEAYGVPFDVSKRVLTTPYRRNMEALLVQTPSWHQIITSSGPTFGLPVAKF
jgi:arsenate reductase-like glutaredoxin family protein